MAEYPFISGVKALNNATLPLFKMYAWNFERNDFERDGNGKMKLLEGNAALKVWIMKALKTERYIWLAYSSRYGSELKKYIGLVMGVKERISEMKRMIVECIMVNPYVVSIEKMDFIQKEHSRELTVNIELTTIYGRMTL